MTSPVQSNRVEMDSTVDPLSNSPQSPESALFVNNTSARIASARDKRRHVTVPSTSTTVYLMEVGHPRKNKRMIHPLDPQKSTDISKGELPSTQQAGNISMPPVVVESDEASLILEMSSSQLTYHMESTELPATTKLETNNAHLNVEMSSTQLTDDKESTALEYNNAKLAVEMFST
ncbi:unnamed protein product [Mytilus coruscus]|uniref:Uncharacterized protein n=1 Tax=Mytilus coruscus TaxID=42192 RepID=A0A6J8CQU1_MYTCO|nr:unnamed protein product [Mytilus coruscus]